MKRVKPIELPLKGTFLFAALGLTASCSANVHPSADRVAQRLGSAAIEEFDVQNWLVRRGFAELDPKRYGGTFSASGPCFEKARGGAWGGVDIVRVCWTESAVVVLSRNTHGHGWTEVFPANLMEAPYGRSLVRISEETAVELKK